MKDKQAIEATEQRLREIEVLSKGMDLEAMQGYLSALGCKLVVQLPDGTIRELNIA